MFSAYVIGSSVSGEACPGSDIDLTVFSGKVAKPVLRFGEEVSLAVLPWPENGLIYDVISAVPSKIASALFLASPKKHLAGVDIVHMLSPSAPDVGELILWATVRGAGASYRYEIGDFRGVLKNYVRLVWAVVFYEKEAIPPGTWLGFAESLASFKPRTVPEKYVMEAREACRTLYSCAAIREEVAEEFLEATENLAETIIGGAPRS